MPSPTDLPDESLRAYPREWEPSITKYKPNPAAIIPAIATGVSFEPKILSLAGLADAREPPSAGATTAVEAFVPASAAAGTRATHARAMAVTRDAFFMDVVSCYPFNPICTRISRLSMYYIAPRLTMQ
jgi:hypothetical protein